MDKHLIEWHKLDLEQCLSNQHFACYLSFSVSPTILWRNFRSWKSHISYGHFTCWNAWPWERTERRTPTNPVTSNCSVGSRTWCQLLGRPIFRGWETLSGEYWYITSSYYFRFVWYSKKNLFTHRLPMASAGSHCLVCKLNKGCPHQGPSKNLFNMASILR